MQIALRLRFAVHYALRHLLVSILVAAISAAWVYGLLYPAPWQAMLNTSNIFLLLLSVDVICGPLLTLILASPKKSLRERWLDFSFIGVLQVLALLYGLYSLWLARPVVLAFEADRLVVVTAPQVQVENLHHAPTTLQNLPWWGVQKVSTRKAANVNELMQSIDMDLQGISPAMRPDWWQPWDSAQAAMNERAKPIADLLERSPQDAAVLHAAIQKTGLPSQQLRYLPLTSSKSKEWIALLDANLNMVGYAHVDGF